MIDITIMINKPLMDKNDDIPHILNINYNQLYSDYIITIESI